MWALLVAAVLVGLWLQAGQSYQFCWTGKSHGEAARLIPLATQRSSRQLRSTNLGGAAIPLSRPKGANEVANHFGGIASCKKSLLSRIGKDPLALGLFALVAGRLRARPAVASVAPSASTVEFGTKLGAKKWLMGLARLVSGKDANSIVKVASSGVARVESLPVSKSVGVGRYFAFFLVFGTALAYLKNAKASTRLSKELLREQKYKEMMYVEAVSEAMAKLKDPKLKSSARANLEQQLNELDPQGKIRQYLQTGATAMPNLSDMVKRSAPAKKSRSEIEGERMSGASIPKRPDASRRETPSMRSPSSSEPPGNVPPSPQQSEAKKVLRELETSLRQALSTTKRAKLMGLLETRLMAISDQRKRSTALEKIRQKIGDHDYWISYADNNL